MTDAITTPPTPGRGETVRRLLMWGAIAALLLAPALAMRLGAEGVLWTASDFVFAGAVLGGAGVLYELVAASTRKTPVRLAAAAFILLAVLAVWAWAVA